MTLRSTAPSSTAHTPALVLAAHGSRDPRFAATAARLRDRVAGGLPEVSVRLAYLDLNAPLVADELAQLDQPCVLVPLLLAPGYHSEIDLPALAAEHATAAVHSTDVIGTRSFAAALADRLREAGLRDDDGIVLTAVGSSNPLADRLIRRRAVELSTTLHRPVEVVYATQLGPQDRAVRTAVRRLRTAGAGRIVVSPYFLSAGLLTERVEAAVDRLAPGSLIAGPLGTHRDVIDAVTAAYHHRVAPVPSTARRYAQLPSAATLVARA